MIAGFTTFCALQGIALQKLEITTEGEIDLRGFFALDPTTAPGLSGAAHPGSGQGPVRFNCNQIS
jgi:hypothetical protein